jgi:Type ISP C-terminal specificity domain/N-6 DNA Methylase
MAEAAAEHWGQDQGRPWPVGSASRLADAVADFGAAVRGPLAAGIGRAEDQIGDPAAYLIREVGRVLGLQVVTHAEVTLSDLSVRPDYAVDVADAVIGHIEIKRPGKGADPTAWSARSHDGQQWQKLRLLPNVLYTDGQQWGLYRDGQLVGSIAQLSGDLRRAGRSLRAIDDGFARVIERFLCWSPSRPRTLRELVRAVARLCRYLRDEVIEILEYERSARGSRPFTALAEEWRQILFPRMAGSNDFADAYAQTVTFALLLARSAGVSFDGQDLPGIGRKLGKRHALIGRALSILSHPAAADSILVIETLRRVVGAVDWDDLDMATGDAHAMLYETFLEEYDPQLRRLSGSYYTPDRLARVMVQFADQVLRTRLERPWGFAADDVIVVDPAMGTGTFLVEIVDLVAKTVAARQGPGARAQRLRELFKRRLIGFERQVTPYAVAELRLHEALKSRYGVDVPEYEMRFLADTFEDPDTQEIAFGSMYAELQRSREEANRVKRDVPVMVVIGNPPYLDRAHTRDPAPWVEARRDPTKPANIAVRPSLDEFRLGGRRDYKLAATWVFYWRWAIWKAFEAHPREPAGTVVFITPSSYLVGEAFAGMRSHLRRVADEGWIIDVSPEGHQPPVRTRLFPKVQQPLCIGIFARYGSSNSDVPARIHYRAVRGSSEEKLTVLDELRIDDSEWQRCPQDWQAPFLPTSNEDWLHYPALDDLFPWRTPGVRAKRTWVIAPSADVLKRRWSTLTGSPPDDRDALLKVTRDRTADSLPPPIPGRPKPSCPLRTEDTQTPHIMPFAYRSFDPQYLLLDSRVVDYPSPDLWRVAGPLQVFISEQHTHAISDGPGLTFAAFVPDMDHFQGHHGGRVLPLYRDLAATMPNVTPGLLDHIGRVIGRPISGDDLLAYIAAIAAHPGYTRRYRKDLAVPGIRIPLSRESRIWERAVELGRQIVWLHTLARRFADADAGRPEEIPALSDPDTPQILTPIPYSDAEMPDEVRYDEPAQTLLIGAAGRIAPVPGAVWRYSVAGMPVVSKWIGYRLKNPRGRPPATPLDTINTSSWTQTFNDELLNLLNALGRLVRLEPIQETLLRESCTAPLITVAELHHAQVLPPPKFSRSLTSRQPPRNQMLI